MSDIAEDPTPALPPDRRVERTRAALRAAFNTLILAKGYDAVSAADVAAHANIGRSTFYEHFRGKDELLAESLVPLLIPLADACGTAEPSPELAALTAHFWQNRRLARVLMAGRARQIFVGQLARLIEERLAASADGLPGALAAMMLAQAQLALIDAWLTGRHGVSAEHIARHLHAASHAAAQALLRF